MKSRRRIISLAAAVLLAGSGVVVSQARAGNEIRIPVPPLPPLLFPRLPDPRDLIPIPNIKAFFVPDIDVDIVFRDGYWWTPQDGRWHRSKDYRGPYVVVPSRQVPVDVIRLPPRFRTVYVKEKRIPYGQWKKMHGHKGKDREGGEYRDRDDRYDDRGEGHKGKKGHGKKH
ncbi:MAG: hypothetical protein HZB55_05615 [Deltaproteobacteria bacterium]|nr:hypothetical protein [Deltaproteobacteria bacterium]